MCGRGNAVASVRHQHNAVASVRHQHNAVASVRHQHNAVASGRHQHRIYCCILIIVGLEIQSCFNSIKVSFACLQEKLRNFSKYIIVKWCVNWKT